MSAFELGEDRKKTRELYALLKRRGFFWPSYDIYGGVAGFFDLGPLGSLLKDNIENAWKDRFVVKEGFLLVDCPSITPEIVFKHSGHLEKFTDQMIRCSGCGTPFRADHLLEGRVENPDSMDAGSLEKAFIEHSVKCPVCGGELQGLEEFNLMFKTHIGPGGDKTAYLRPETAQSIFLNFPLLYRMNRERMPFGVAQIGKGYRNEISPRQGMLRQREFHMAEGEFFFDPEDRVFAPFDEHRKLEVELVPNTDPGRSITRTLGDAVNNGMICSEILAHFMGVTYTFALDIGIPKKHIRFREHLGPEMAHYARDCWDLEVETSSGWIEMVGIADRSAYDLEQHTKGSGQELLAKRKLRDVRTMTLTNIEVDLKVLGPIFRSTAKPVSEAILSMDPASVRKAVASGEELPVVIGNETLKVPSTAVRISDTLIKVSTEDYIPHVVEPSFGIDRLMVAVLEHAYFEAEKSPMKEEAGEDEGPYRVLRLDRGISPIKCGVFPLMNKDGLPEIAREIEKSLRKTGLTTYFDHSGSIGRRYARMDEIGTPFSITVDYGSLTDNAVTIRFRDTGEQIRVHVKDVTRSIMDLLEN